MSLQFSDTDNYRGIIQGIEREFGWDYGYLSGNTIRLKEWTADINLTHDEALALIFNRAGGSPWQYDDTNHSKYPIIKTNLVSGKRDYTFTTDEQGNVILDIYRILVADREGVLRDVYNADQQTPDNQNSNTDLFVDGRNETGVPTKADKTANGIFLDYIPNYSVTDGIQLYINREGSYFTHNDTTKKPGIAGLYHEYYIVNPCYRHAQRKNLDNKNSLLERKLALEDGIRRHYGFRDRGVKQRLQASIESTR